MALFLMDNYKIIITYQLGYGGEDIILREVYHHNLLEIYIEAKENSSMLLLVE